MLPVSARPSTWRDPARRLIARGLIGGQGRDGAAGQGKMPPAGSGAGVQKLDFCRKLGKVAARNGFLGTTD